MKNFLFVFFLTPVCFAATQFVVIGDTGKDNDGQKLVSEALARHCSLEKCDYGMLAGDNIYDDGMSSALDRVLDRMFKKYYENLQFPFFVTLGNHDYGKLSNQWQKGAWQVGYAQTNSQFHLPHYYYLHESEDFVLVVLDTTRMMWDKDMKEQKELMEKATKLAHDQNKFLIVLGHHPYLSNGNHGNAGSYEGVRFPSFVAGTDLKKFFDKNICGKADLYISGHDHNLQLLEGEQKNCNTLLLVSGAGASTEELHTRNRSVFETSTLGFASLNIERDKIIIRMINSKNEKMFEGELKKRRLDSTDIE